jgi:hypothetical protein
MRTLILCPACGADRLVPLNFPQFRPEAGPGAAFRRPIAKCSGCGERVFAHLVDGPHLIIASDHETIEQEQSPGPQSAA